MSRDGLYRTIFSSVLVLIGSAILITAWGAKFTNPSIALSEPTTVIGSIGDGPITGAKVTILSANGKMLASEVSDNTAKYEFTLNHEKKHFPLILEANEGTDLVTGLKPSFTLVSTILRRSKKLTVNINPFSTLITKSALAMPGGLNKSNFLKTRKAIYNRLSFGLNSKIIRDPVRSRINRKNMADIVKASELLAEMIRRTRTALIVGGLSYNDNQIIEILAGDFSDGVLDGRGPGANALVSAISNIVSGQVLVEGMSNQLIVNGTIATDLMDTAIGITTPSAKKMTADVLITKEMILQSEIAVAATQIITPSPELSNLVHILQDLPADSSAEYVSSKLPEDARLYFDQAIFLVATASAGEIDAVNAAVRAYATEEDQQPEVTLSVSPKSVSYNESISLNWSSVNASNCTASGAWRGPKGIKGSMVLGPLKVDSVFVLSCNGAGGETKTSAIVKVTQNNLIVKLAANSLLIPYNGTVTLNWISENADSCTASGAWSGKKKLIGNETLRKLKTKSSFILQCNGSSGKSSASVVIDVEPPPPPTVKLSTDTSSLPYGGIPTLTWTSMHTSSCTASGSWSGTKAVSDSQLLDPLKKDGTFILSCMGAGGTVSTSETITCSNCNIDFKLILSWDKNPDVITGYKVYRGATTDTVTDELSDIPVTASYFDPEQPSVSYHYSNDLNLTLGQEQCFKIKAYNDIGASGFSKAVCTEIW